MALAPNKKLLASTHRGGAVELWDLTTRTKKTLGQHFGDACAVTFSPDGKLLVSTGQDALARVWTVEDGKLWKTLEGHKSVIPHAAFSPDGKRLATASWDSSIMLWDLNEDAPETSK